VAPFAGAKRNLCDRKLVTLDDEGSVLAKFYIYTSTHAAAHFTGIITDDFTSEFDPFSPTSARSSPRPTCRWRSRTGPETKSRACIRISGEATPA